MFGFNYSVTNRLIAIAALALWMGLAADGAAQTDAVKTDATTTAAGQAAAPNSAAPGTAPAATKADSANSNAQKPYEAPTEGVKSGEPADPKARKTFASAIDWERHGHDDAALDDFRKANKQDGGQCWDCLNEAYRLAIKLDAYKDAVDIAREWLPLAQTDKEKSGVEFRLAMALQEQGIKEKRDKYIAESAEDFKAAIEHDPKLARAHFHYGVTLARLHQDDAARAEFTAFLDQDRKNPTLHSRAERFVDRIDLARATMAPPFSLTTLDGQHITMDSLAGKVVLIDFWATWCGPCREALPHMRSIAKKFNEQPFVMLSISLDKDEAEWMHFVEKNGMSWMQYRDAGGFSGRIAKSFGVSAIPATFSIDADGVLEDQHVGDADIEGKLKKLIARAAEVNNRKSEPVAVDKAPEAAN
jgi:thiol-disulfide isomerase/thioredoxin